MALGATMRRFEIALADSDRGVYEELDLRVAQHPSESAVFLVARVIARALEHAEGMEFGRGVSTDDEPAIWQRDLRGDLLAWIEIGSPSAERLKKASRRAPRVAVYTWRDADGLDEHAEVISLDRAFLEAVAEGLDRNNRWELSVSGGTIYLAAAGIQHQMVLMTRARRD